MLIKLIFPDDDDHFNREKWAHLDVTTPNIWWMSCYSNEDFMEKLEACQNLPGIESIEVVYE